VLGLTAPAGHQGKCRDQRVTTLHHGAMAKGSAPNSDKVERKTMVSPGDG
jgi:hypothetical protein